MEKQKFYTERTPIFESEVLPGFLVDLITRFRQRTNSIRPSEFDFTGCVKDKTEQKNVVRELKATPQLPLELEITPERKKCLKAMLEAVAEFGNDLGIDLSSRLPKVKQFHFFDKPNYNLAVRENGEPIKDREKEGGHYKIYGLLVKEIDESELEILSRANHELVHAITRNSFDLSLSGNELTARHRHTGYHFIQNSVFQLFNEALVEATNMRIREHYWPRYDVLAEIKRQGNIERMGYAQQVVLVHELVAKASQAAGHSSEDGFRTLQRGMILGEMQATRFLTDYIGPQGMRLVSKLPKDFHELAHVARQLGLMSSAKFIEGKS